MAKDMIYKEEDGTKYKISFSEELQMKNLNATRESTKWQKMNFYAKLFLGLVMLALFVTVLYVLFILDKVDFITTLLYK